MKSEVKDLGPDYPKNCRDALYVNGKREWCGTYQQCYAYKRKLETRPSTAVGANRTE